jgi:NitT/TauT family transport system permease protein
MTEPGPSQWLPAEATGAEPAARWPALVCARAGPVALVVAVLLLAWYALAVWLNAPRVIERLEGAGEPWGARALAQAAWSMERPVLPAPHQIAANWYSSVFEAEVDSPHSLVFHAGVTLASTLLGFVLGMLLGVLIAIGVVHNRVLDRGLLPWIIASQTIPILAIAPMVVVVLGSLGYPPLVSKAVISMYLCFFPVAVGMVKGLRSPDTLELDLMRTYSASGRQVLAKLRLPASLPFLFASAKVAIATSLIGAIVGELPTGAQAGLGARLLSGSYFGQTIQIWSALLMASLLGVLLVAVVGAAERAVDRLMGARP